MMDNQTKYWSQSLPLLLCTLLLSSCGGRPQAASMPPVSVEIERAESTQVKASTEYNARVEGVNNAVIKPRVTGLVKQVYAKLGDRVKVGDPLIMIDSSQQRANFESRLAVVESRRAQLASATANLDAQKAELRRLQAELDYQSEEADLRDAEQTFAAEEQEKQRIEYELEFFSEPDDLQDAQENFEAALKERDRLAAVRDERQKSFDRYEQLWEQGVVPTEQYDQRLRDLQTAEADLAGQEDQVRAAKARVRSAEQDLERKKKTLEAQIISQQNRVESAQAKIESAQQAFERRVSTLDAQIESQQKVIAAQEAEVERLKREIEQAQADAVSEQVQLQYYNIEAPIAGIVGNVPVKVGDLVNSQTTLTSVRSNNRLEVNIDIPVERLPQVRVGTPVELVRQGTGEVIGNSRISFISPSAGTGTQTILVKAIYENRGNKLRTDQIVRARVIWDQKPGVTVPTTAITRIGAQSFVFVVEEQEVNGELLQVAKQQPVELGSIQEQSYEVISGVKAGDQIVTEGVVKLQDGTPVMDVSEQIPSEQIPSEQIPSEQIPSEQIPSEQIPSEQIPSEQIPQQSETQPEASSP